MKILFVENLSINADNPMSTLYPTKVKKITENKNFDFYDISQEFNISATNYENVLFGARAIYLYKCYKNPEIKKDLENKFNYLMAIKNKFVILQDMHKKTYNNIKNLCAVLKKYNFGIIFTFFNNKEAKNIRENTHGCNYYHIPMHINDNIFKKIECSKIYDVLLYGSTHPSHYPFRNRLFNLILNNTDKFNVKYIRKPEKFDPEYCEDGLAKIINQSKLTISTKSAYDYFVAKYLEISACNSIIVGNVATDGIDIIKNYVKVDEYMTDNEILNIFTDAIKDYDENFLKQYTNDTSKYNLDVFVEKLLKIIKL